jgi:hypothetical protein
LVGRWLLRGRRPSHAAPRAGAPASHAAHVWRSSQTSQPVVWTASRRACYGLEHHTTASLSTWCTRPRTAPRPQPRTGRGGWRSASLCVPLDWTFFPWAMGWGSEVLICPICLAGVVGGRLWLTGFPLCFCEKYGKLARTDLKNERISRSGGFQACYEIIRRVGGWSESRPESQYTTRSTSTSEPHP